MDDWRAAIAAMERGEMPQSIETPLPRSNNQKKQPKRTSSEGGGGGGRASKSAVQELKGTVPNTRSNFKVDGSKAAARSSLHPGMSQNEVFRRIRPVPRPVPHPSETNLPQRKPGGLLDHPGKMATMNMMNQEHSMNDNNRGMPNFNPRDNGPGAGNFDPPGNRYEDFGGQGFGNNSGGQGLRNNPGGQGFENKSIRFEDVDNSWLKPGNSAGGNHRMINNQEALAQMNNARRMNPMMGSSNRAGNQENPPLLKTTREIWQDLERDRAEGEAFMAKIKEKEQELKKREEAIAKRAKEAEIIKKIEEKERNLRMKEEKLMRMSTEENGYNRNQDNSFVSPFTDNRVDMHHARDNGGTQLPMQNVFMADENQDYLNSLMNTPEHAKRQARGGGSSGPNHDQEMVSGFSMQELGLERSGSSRPSLLGDVPRLDENERQYRFSRMESALKERKDRKDLKKTDNMPRGGKGGKVGMDTKGGMGGKAGMDTIDDFDWNIWSEEAFFNIPHQFLTCHDCQVQVRDEQSYVRHIRGVKHRNVMKALEKRNEEDKKEMREQINKFESSNVKSSKEKGYCNLCEATVYGPMAIHRGKGFHRALKSFVHTFCSFCAMEFKTRTEYEIHRFGPEHIRSITVANMTKRVVTEFDLAFKKELEELKRLNGKKGSNSNKEETGNNSKKDLPDLLDEVKKDRDRRRRNSKNDNKRDERKDEKKSEKKEDKDGNKKKGDENAKKEDTSDDDDIEEICVITKAQAKPQEGKTKEGKDQNQKSEASQTEPPKDPKAELLENLVIGDFDTYDETKAVGEDYLRPVSGFFCRVCKKLLLDAKESANHMKSKPHWDNCVKARKGVSAKRKAQEDIKTDNSKQAKEA